MKPAFAQLLETFATDRRSFQRMLASLGLGLVVAPLAPSRGRAAAAMSYSTWAGYEVPELHRPFISKYGASPDISFFAEEEEALAKLRSGFAPDVAHPCASNIAKWRDAGVLKPIDTTRLRNFPDLIPELLSIPGAQADGAQWIIPCDWGGERHSDALGYGRQGVPG